MTEVAGAETFPHAWKARVLSGQPLIMPARCLTLPVAVPGEEDALARGALWVEVMPLHAPPFVVQCGLGYAGKGVAHGIWSMPHRDQLLAIAGGYAYAIDTRHPEDSVLLHMRPVVKAFTAIHAEALVLTGFHTLCVLTAGGLWESPRLSWEGVTIERIEGELLHGSGWHMRTDRELPFTVNLRTREVLGGAFLP